MIAKDDTQALKLVSEFEATIYTPAVVRVQSQKVLKVLTVTLGSLVCFLSRLHKNLRSLFFKPLQALVRCAEDVIHTLAEILPFEGQIRDHWVLDLERLKEKVYSAVQFILQTLRSVSKYHRNYKKVGHAWTPLL